MKVLIIGQLPVEAGGTYTTGVCNVVYELSKCATKDVEMVVYATNMKDSLGGSNEHVKYRGTKINLLQIACNVFKNPIDTWREWTFYIKQCNAFPIRHAAYSYNIKRIINEEKPDVLHVMNVLQIASCYYANKDFKLPIVLTLHGANLDLNSMDHLGVKLADMVTGLTPDTMQGIIQLGAPKEKMSMIPNGTDTYKFYFDEIERKKLREELSISDDTTVMLTIGSLSHRKGQLSFLSILTNLPKDFKYLYLIIGKGVDDEKIFSYIEEHGMQDKVKVIGYVNNSELFRYHSAADVYVHSSRWEGQALSEVEAYATDLKIAVNKDVLGTIITDTSNQKDYLIFDFDHFDNDNFTKWASQHKVDRKTRRLYDWRRVFEMYTEVYKHLLCFNN